MLSRIPLNICLVVMVTLSVSSFFVHRQPYAVAIAFDLFAIAWSIVTISRGLRDLKSIRARAVVPVHPRPTRDR